MSQRKALQKPKKKVVDNFMCLHCPHSKYSLRDDGTCGGLDAAGDTCECPQYVPDKSRPVDY
jgi:hypothetical protein